MSKSTSVLTMGIVFILSMSFTMSFSSQAPEYLLYDAIKSERVEDVQRIVLAHPEAATKPRCLGNTPLHDAAEKNNTRIIQILIAHGADINAKDYPGNTPLHYTAKYNTSESAAILIRHGADINSQNHYGETPLHFAAQARSISVMRLLIQHGAGINLRTQREATPLHYGAHFEDVVQLLVRHGANIDATNGNNATPLHLAAHHVPNATPSAQYIDYLMRLGADITIKDNKERTALHYVAHSLDQEEVQALLQAGAVTDEKDSTQCTPLLLAIRRLIAVRIRYYMLYAQLIEVFLQFGVPLQKQWEIAELEKYPDLYEHAQNTIQARRKFLQDHIPAIEQCYLEKDYEHLQLSDDLRRLLLDLIATPELPSLV